MFHASRTFTDDAMKDMKREFSRARIALALVLVLCHLPRMIWEKDHPEANVITEKEEPADRMLL